MMLQGAVDGHVIVFEGFGYIFTDLDDLACAGCAVDIIQACYRSGWEGSVYKGFVAGVDGGCGHFYEQVSGGCFLGLWCFFLMGALFGGDANGFHVDFFSKVAAILYFYK